MHPQFWSIRHSVLRTLGGKEDECIVASDAELDAKLELFRSISDSCNTLQRILEQYQERLCVLAQEETATGRFLRDAGHGEDKKDETHGEDAAAKHMIAAGKAIGYAGQQRLMLRGPLLRMYHEVETFRCRAVSDTRATVADMEKARGEYRAALGWMKAASAQLDPDTGRGLDKFRRAQEHTKQTKKRFDKLTLDVLQKIDLLAAARCNMFSQVLANYQSSFASFASKAHQTLQATCTSMRAAPKYDFCILKELTQDEGRQTEDVQPTDKDQLLFFQDEYRDDVKENKSKPSDPTSRSEVPNDLLASDKQLVDQPLVDTSVMAPSSDVSEDLLGLSLDAQELLSLGSFMPSQLLQDSSPQGLFQGLLPASVQGDIDKSLIKSAKPSMKPESKKTDMSAWFKVFAELDPLANPDAIPGATTSQSHAA